MKRILLAALPLCLAAAPAAAQQESGAFVIRLGRDTVAVEQFTRTATALTGTLVTRSPRTTVRTYTAELRPDGTIARLEMTARVPSAPELLPQTVTITAGGDTATWRIQRADSVREGRFAAPADAFPWVTNAYGLAEPALRHARARGVDSAAVAVVQPGAPRPVTVSFIRHGADSVLIRSGTGVTRVRTDAEGRVLGGHSPESTFKADIERVDRLDVQAIAADFARRDQAGQQMGSLSPRDSVAARVGGADVSVAYGRPSMRGRRIMGQVVPYGQVWRTGANDATHFRTDRDLVFGETRVPAGSYTLWSIPAEDGWTLIFNRQTGQWGTEYRPEQDVARIPARSRRIPGAPVEQLTMRIDQDECGGGGVLVLEWENTRVMADFVVAR